MDEENNKTTGEEVEEPKQTEKTEDRDKSRLSVEKIRKSINENKPAVLGGVFLVLFLVAASTYYLYWSEQQLTPDPVTAPFDEIEEEEENGLPEDMEDTEEVEFLPSDENDVEDVDQEEEDELPERPMDPFAGPASLKGVLMSDDANDLAIIEAGGTSYVVGKGDIIADYWKVERISRNSVYLKANGRDLELHLNR
ncbi:MAG: hypothetical protein D5R97_09555 [Candidatus Syntrophonatronum acetioxidans]|uniref:Uncharacterized protein n=1 Tax=Candidatus Syntrophonatronum acetioxidans TaxID=1795816 RepID=A0A424YAE7_9FIRM|nr:MAG: hypothetical protein D5R97_09555 [Candidatus Syntrophonatronum acetioxidans]